MKPADLPQNLASIGAAEAIVEESAAPENDELVARGWWLRNNPDTMDQCITYLRDLVTNQATPYDGVFGFSQGACAAVLLTSMLEHPGAIPGFTSNGDAPHPPLKFCIAVAGFRPMSPAIDTLMAQGVNTPTLIVQGVNDQIVDAERSQTLIDVCPGARVEKHEGGHFIPSKATWRQFFASYIRLEDYAASTIVPSPNPLLTGSGASTPAVMSRPPSR